MPPEFLDTNILVRYLTRDNPDQSPRAAAYLDPVAIGAQQATTCESVIVETVQVLSSRTLYNLTRDQVRDYLEEVLSMEGLILPDREIYRRALELWAAASTAIDFVDVLNIAHMEAQGITTIISFDRGFDRFPQITRREP